MIFSGSHHIGWCGRKGWHILWNCMMFSTFEMMYFWVPHPICFVYMKKSLGWSEPMVVNGDPSVFCLMLWRTFPHFWVILEIGTFLSGVLPGYCLTGREIFWENLGPHKCKANFPYAWRYYMHFMSSIFSLRRIQNSVLMKRCRSPGQRGHI